MAAGRTNIASCLDLVERLAVLRKIETELDQRAGPADSRLDLLRDQLDRAADVREPKKFRAFDPVAKPDPTFIPTAAMKK